MISFLGGILFTNIFGKTYILGVGLLGEYFLLHFQYTQINYSNLFEYVFKERIKLILLIGILGITNIGVAVICCLFVWLGFSSGVLLSVAIMKFGLKGIAICTAGIFPQFLIYVPMILIFSDKIIDKKFTERLTFKKQNLLKYCFLVFLAILVMTVGVLLESYINPYILKKVISIVGLSR
ncbi:MAG: stage II sporulation protein M [Lachnotalea sp.]